MSTGHRRFRPARGPRAAHAARALAQVSAAAPIRAAACFALALLAAPPASALPPIFVSAPPTTGTQGIPYAYRAHAIDLDFGDRVVHAAPQLPAWLVFDGIDSISGVPGPADVGTHAVTLTASDGSSTATQSFDIVIANVDDPPQLVAPIAPDPQALNERAPYTFDVTPFFADPDGDALAYDQSGLPPDLAIDAATGVISGSPRFPRTGAPQYAVTITATNAGGTASDSFILIINNENDAPSIPEPVPVVTAHEDEPFDLTPEILRAQDEDPGDTLTILVQPPPTGAHYTVDGTRVQPAANFSGTLQLQARVRDAAGAVSNLAKVVVEVEPRNDAPLAKSIPAQRADEGAPFTFDAAPYFSDAENDRLTYRASGLPPGLAIDSVSGVIAGTPPIDTQARDYHAAIVASDGSAEGTATLRTTIVRARRADLVASVTAAPSPSIIGNEVTWTLGVSNASATDVTNVTLAAVFSGDVPLTFASPSRSECAVTPGATATTLDCRFAALPANGAAEIKIGAAASRAGTAFAAVRVATVESLPIEENASNNAASAVLGIAERLSAGPAQRLTVQNARAAAAADLDGDGYAELALATAAGPVAFRNIVDPANSKKRRLADVPVRLADDSTHGNGIALADLDGDGDLDAVTANIRGQPNQALINDGGATFTAATIAGTTAAASRAVALGDVNGDGRIDAVFATEGASTVHTNAAGSFLLAQTVGGADARDAVLVSLLGDPLPELVLANGDGNAAVYRNSAGRLELELELATGPATSVAAADFDRDGDADIVLGRAGSADVRPAAVVFLNTSAASGAFFGAAELLGGSLDVLAADFDGDGDPDIAAFGADGGHRLYLNDGAARFTLQPEQFVHAGAAGAAAAKLSVDDRIDIAVAGGTAVGIFLDDGNGNFGRGDGIAPAVSLRGAPTLSVTVGQAYQDSGAAALDDVDGDLTHAIVVKNPVDTALVGTYAVTYEVTDSSGNTASVTRTVEVTPQVGTGGGGGGALGPELALLLSAFLYRRLKQLGE